MVDWKNKDKLEDYIAFISYNILLGLLPLCAAIIEHLQPIF
jgi:hypothetical protein